MSIKLRLLIIWNFSASPLLGVPQRFYRCWQLPRSLSSCTPSPSSCCQPFGRPSHIGNRHQETEERNLIKCQHYFKCIPTSRIHPIWCPWASLFPPISSDLFAFWFSGRRWVSRPSSRSSAAFSDLRLVSSFLQSMNRVRNFNKKNIKNSRLKNKEIHSCLIAIL